MAKQRAILMVMAVTTAAMIIELAMATNHTVGAPGGTWDTSTDFQTWSSSHSFLVGDNLIFEYDTIHDVLEVSKTDYDACQIANPIETYNGGKTVITLSSPGKRYFICGTFGHCTLGMFVEIDTLPSSPPSPTPQSPPPSSPPISTPPPKSPPTSPPPVSAPPQSQAPPPTIISPKASPPVLTPTSAPPPDKFADSPPAPPPEQFVPAFSPLPESPSSRPAPSPTKPSSPPPSPSSAYIIGFGVDLSVQFCFMVMMFLSLAL